MSAEATMDLKTLNPRIIERLVYALKIDNDDIHIFNSRNVNIIRIENYPNLYMSIEVDIEENSINYNINYQDLQDNDITAKIENDIEKAMDVFIFALRMNRSIKRCIENLSRFI